jgi:hypothetical protein
MFERLQKARQASGEEEGGSDEEDRTAGNGSQGNLSMVGRADTYSPGKRVAFLAPEMNWTFKNSSILEIAPHRRSLRYKMAIAKNHLRAS